MYAGTSILNGYGELIGIDQINEWGLLHSPVVITSSLAIGLAYDTTARWIAQREPAQGRSDVIMPVVTECDDSFLNDARAFPLSPRTSSPRSTVPREARWRRDASGPEPGCSASTSRAASARPREWSPTRPAT